MAEVSGWKAFSTQPFIERVLIMIHYSFMRGSPGRNAVYTARSCDSAEVDGVSVPFQSWDQHPSGPLAFCGLSRCPGHSVQKPGRVELEQQPAPYVLQLNSRLCRLVRQPGSWQRTIRMSLSTQLFCQLSDLSSGLQPDIGGRRPAHREASRPPRILRPFSATAHHVQFPPQERASDQDGPQAPSSRAAPPHMEIHGRLGIFQRQQL